MWLPEGLSAHRAARRVEGLPFAAFGIGSRFGGLWAGSFTVLWGGREVELTSAPAATLLRVDLRHELTATHGLVERARRHLRTRLTLTASIPGSRGRSLRAEVPLTVGLGHRGAAPVDVKHG